MTRFRRLSLAAATGLIATTITVSMPAQAHETGIHDNCTNFKRYPHGVGTRRAHDRTSGDPVTQMRTSFAALRST